MYVKYKHGWIKWEDDDRKYFSHGYHEMYGEAQIKYFKDCDGFFYKRIMFKKAPSKFEKEEGIYEGNIENYFRHVAFKYRCMACNQLKNDQGAWRYYKRVLSKVCRKCAPHYRKAKGK